MSSGYRSRQERDADVAKTRAETEKLRAEAAGAAQVAEVGAAKTETDKLAEQIKQAKLRKQLSEVNDTAKDDNSRRKAQRREQRAEDGHVFKLLVNIVMTLGLLAALPAQISYFINLHRPDDKNPSPAWSLAPVPFFLEILAWVGVQGTKWAHRKGLPRWPFWLLTASLAATAGYINMAHGAAEYGIVAGLALAATSVIGPLLAEVRQYLESKAAEDGRSLQQRAKDRRAERDAAKVRRAQEKVWQTEDEDRAEEYPNEFKEFRRIMIAYPTGAISRETAWERAWDTCHALPLSVTAGSLAAREVARTAIETLLEDADRSPESVAVDLFLTAAFQSGGGDDGPTGAPAGGLPGGPTGEGHGPALSTLRRPLRPLGGKGSAPFGCAPPRRPRSP